jgi:hypothetical protein
MADQEQRDTAADGHPTEPARASEGLQNDNRRNSLTGVEGYSPDTLHALFDA